MHWTLVLCFGLFISPIHYPSTVNAIEMSVDEPLTPELSFMSGNEDSNENIANQKNEGERSIDDFLGPEDRFPFLPDNHRDSGTGKFNSF